MQYVLQHQFRTSQIRSMLGAYGHYDGRLATPTHPDYLIVIQRIEVFRASWPISIEDILVDQYLYRMCFTHTPLYQCVQLGAVCHSWYLAISYSIRFQGNVVVRPSLPPPGHRHIFADSLVLRHTDDEYHCSTNGTILQGLRYVKIRPPLN